jgi:hypothetical protein
MKNAREPARHMVLTLGQLSRGVPGIKRRCGRRHNAPAPSAALAERGRRGHALGAVLALALLLFAVPGMGAAITGASARTPQHLSARSWAARPTKTPPPRHAPTPTTVPSPTLTAPPRRERQYRLGQHLLSKRQRHQSAGNQVAVKGEDLFQHCPHTTSSPAVHQLSRVQQQGRGLFSLSCQAS